jgi:hypothetical protein
MRFLTFQVRSVRDTTARTIKQAIPAQGAAERRDRFREDSKGDVDSIRARERLFTGFPQILDVGDAAKHEQEASPIDRLILAKVARRTQQNFGLRTPSSRMGLVFLGSYT